MSRRKKPDARCELCCMRQEICICGSIDLTREALRNIETRVVVLMHHRERYLTTGTARLAQLSLPHCEIRLRGLPGEPLDTNGILEDQRQALLLYPSEDSQVLSSEYLRRFDRPFTLVVPDGSWRQAAKVARRESFLANVPRVRLESEKPTTYRLRREIKAGGLATFEAIARALGIMEGPQVEARLEALFDRMVNQTLESRGVAKTLPQVPL